VSYVTVVRNNATTLPRTIESVQRQTYPAVEHVILDGRSTDGTLDVIRRYGERVDYFASDPDDGLYDALNKAIPLARGDLICVLNSDDWLEAGAAQAAATLVNDPKAPAILLTAANSRHPQSGEEEPPFAQQWHPARVHAGSYFTCADDCHNAIYATRAAYERTGPYDVSYDIAADFKWLMTCFESGVAFHYSHDITVNYVLGGASGDAQKHGIECVRVIRDRFPSLSPEEAGGLYHTFFAFPTFPIVPGRPDDELGFLRRLLEHHPDDEQLAIAVAWALISDGDRRGTHACEQVVEETRMQQPSFKEVVKLALKDHPRVYRAVRYVHQRAHRA
jgi:glycosyltransferase involved in cell wall biosynthesis